MDGERWGLLHKFCNPYKDIMEMDMDMGDLGDLPSSSNDNNFLADHLHNLIGQATTSTPPHQHILASTTTMMLAAWQQLQTHLQQQKHAADDLQLHNNGLLQHTAVPVASAALLAAVLSSIHCTKF